MTTSMGNRGQLWTSTLSPHLLSPRVDFPELSLGEVRNQAVFSGDFTGRFTNLAMQSQAVAWGGAPETNPWRRLVVVRPLCLLLAQTSEKVC